MKKKSNESCKVKTVFVSPNVHSELKIRAIRAEENLNPNFTDIIVMLGLEEYDKAKKISP